jgi:hypothetical protein
MRLIGSGYTVSDNNGSLLANGFFGDLDGQVVGEHNDRGNGLLLVATVMLVEIDVLQKKADIIP